MLPLKYIEAFLNWLCRHSLANGQTVSWRVCSVSDWHQIWQAFIFHMDELWLQSRMYKFSFEPSLLRLRLEILLSPLTSLSMMLILLAAPILLIHRFVLNAHIICFVRWCIVLLGHIIEFFYIGPRVAKWASLCLSRRVGHRPPRLHHGILLYWNFHWHMEFFYIDTLIATSGPRC